MPIGREHIVVAIASKQAVPTIVNLIHFRGELSQLAIRLLACILSFPQIQNSALRTPVIQLLLANLTATANFGTQIDAACALAAITSTEVAKYSAVDNGAIPPLVAALSSSLPTLKQMAVRAVNNMASVKPGRQAAYAAGAVQPLVALLDPRSPNPNLQYDTLQALKYIATLHSTARKNMNKCGAFWILKGFEEAPLELQKVAEDLRDELRSTR